MVCHKADAAQQAAWRSSGERPSCPQRYFLGLEIGSALARSAGGVRPVHHLLQPLRSLAEGWCLERYHRRSCRCPRCGCPDDRHLHCPRASARSVHHKEPASVDGTDEGWVDQRIHALVDSNGLPVRLALSPGKAHDNRLAGKLLSRLKSGSMLLADRGYDADWIRELAMKKGAWANIPPKSNRSDPICFSPYLCRARNRVERFFNRIRQCRRVATRYDKLAANYLAFVQLASIRLWLRLNESAS